MKFLISVLLTSILSLCACFYLPWWSIAIAAFIVAILIPQRPGRAFLTGFLALLLLWAGLCLWIDMRNEHLLSKKIAFLLSLGGSYILVIILSALIGALVAGFGAMSGSTLRRIK